MTATPGGLAVPAPGLDEYLVNRHLATHRERFLAGRENKRHLLLSLIDFLAPTSIVPATGPQLAAWLGDDGVGSFEFACLSGFYSWCVGEGMRADNPVATLWPAVPALVVVTPPPVASREAPRPAWSAAQVDHFYTDMLEALGKLAQSGGTAVGAGAVVKRVAVVHGIDAAGRLPVPRLTRAELEDLAWQRSQPERPCLPGSEVAP